MSSSVPGGSTKREEAAALLKTVEEIAESAASPIKDSQVTLSTGVVVDIVGGISLAALDAIDRKFQPPPIPKVFMEDRGREIENPADPYYIEAVQKVSTAKGLAVVDAVIILCTKVSHIPEGMLGPEDEEWLERVAVLGFDMPTTKSGKYLIWMKMYAAVNEQDWANLTSAAMRRMGVREVDTADAIASFQRDSQRGPDNAGQADG